MSAHRIVVLLLEDVLPLDLGIPLQVFGREELPHYSVSTASLGGLPVGMLGGTSVAPSAGLEALESADTVIVPGHARAENPQPTEVLDALRSAHARGARLVSICSGAFALAQAGVLDGRRATTHWQSCAQLAAQHPLVDVDPDVLYVDEGTVLTSAGVAAGIDLCLHIVRRDLGASVANRVARSLVAAPRREGGQAQFIERPIVATGSDPLAYTREWMLRSLAEPITVTAMAATARSSVRSFSRNFASQTGQTPLRWLHAQRIELARELLETSDLSIDEIAARSGLGSPANFRTHFKRATSLAPQRYRVAFTER